MNRTNFEHAIIATIFTLVGAFLGNAWVGAAFAIGVFGGREHAQREKKLAKGGNVNGFAIEALKVLNWSLDAKLDLLFPVVASISTAALVKYLAG